MGFLNLYFKDVTEITRFQFRTYPFKPNVRLKWSTIAIPTKFHEIPQTRRALKSITPIMELLVPLTVNEQIIELLILLTGNEQKCKSQQGFKTLNTNSISSTNQEKKITTKNNLKPNSRNYEHPHNDRIVFNQYFLTLLLMTSKRNFCYVDCQIYHL